MTKKSTLFVAACTALFTLTTNNLQAQMKSAPTKQAYLSTGMDGYILSTAINNAGLKTAGSSIGTPRFTAFFHLGVNVNYDFNKNIGMYTGLGIKNIGFIEKFDLTDYTVKRRVYTVGIPIGVKIGNVKHGSYFLAGGGVDFPFNYKEKGFVKRNDKEKFNEWFSNRTPAAMPYVFVGMHMRPLLTFKVQYYPGNFMNSDFQQQDASGFIYKPYQGYDVKLLLFTAGFDISYKPKK